MLLFKKQHYVQTSIHPFSKILVYLQAQYTVEKQCSDAGPWFPDSNRVAV